MIFRFLYTVIVLAGLLAFGTGCNNPASEDAGGDTPVVPAGASAILSEGFGGDLSQWDLDYMIIAGAPHYVRMTITGDAAHTGKMSVMSDSNQTALLYSLDADHWVADGIVGVQFYMMAKEKGGINFTVEIGKNAGSSGGLGHAFGIGFDPNDSIKCKFYDMLGSVANTDTMIQPMELDHWYKCVVEVSFTTGKITYSIDDGVVLTRDIPTTSMTQIDRLLVFRGASVERPDYSTALCSEGPKKYYVDDIVFYKK